MAEEPLIKLSERGRAAVALLLVLLAVVHLIFPELAIDGVFLGLLGMAGLVLFFDIHSVEALGVKAKARALQEAREVVESTELPVLTTIPAPVPAQLSPGMENEPAPHVDHREAFDLGPPVERVARILWAAEQIRIELVILAASAGLLTQRGSWSHYRLQDLAPRLADKAIVPSEFLHPVRAVMDIRNAVAHGERVASQVLESTDELAMTVLSRLRELPRTYYRVRKAGLELYEDRSLTTRHPFSGVMIEQRDKDGRVIHSAVYPTHNDYVNGRFVTWDWDFSAGTDQEAWFMDPDTRRPTMAFSSAAVFAGRELPEQWGLEYRAGPLLE